MKYNQMTIFDLTNINKKEEILNNLEKYNIDNLYRKYFKTGSYTFLEIYNIFSKNKMYEEYLETLSQELKKYIQESDNCHQDFIEKKQSNTFTKREDCIMIYNYIEKSVGPIYCAEMLNKSLFGEVKI